MGEFRTREPGYWDYLGPECGMAGDQGLEDGMRARVAVDRY